MPTPAVQVGDLYIATVTAYDTQTDPGAKLPDTLPLQPYAVSSNPETAPGYQPTNPTTEQYVLTLCNGSTHPHILTGVLAQITSFHGYSGQLNEWNPCNFPYKNPSGGGGGGCGGGAADDEYMQAAFPASASVGTMVTAMFKNTSVWTHLTPLPTNLPSGYAVRVGVTITPPSAPGYYTFSLGLTVDGGTPIIATTTPNVLLAPVTHEWDGTSCSTPDMQTQLAADPPGLYVCPRS